MHALTNIWDNYTLEFSPVQKVIIAVVLGLIFTLVLLAMVLVVLEIVK